MDPMDEVGLGTVLQKARVTAGLTQQQLCGRANISYSTLAKIERGAIKSPSIFTIQSIAAALNLSLNDLLGTRAPALTQVKQCTKSGVSFIYFDINGCLVRFFHRAFVQLAEETGAPADLIETTFWHYNDAVCRGDITLEQFNQTLAKKFGVAKIDWSKHYLAAVDPIDEMHQLVTWAAQHYRVGLLSNIMPGLINDMLGRGLLPNVAYDTIIDSSVATAIKPEDTIYEIAEVRAGVQASELLLVDDARPNLMAAEYRGWHVMWFDDYLPGPSVERLRAALEPAKIPLTN